MENSSQWVYGEISKHNGILLSPSTTHFPPIDKHTNCVRVRLYSSISDLFSTLPTSSDLYYYSSPFPISPLFPHLYLKIHTYICLLLSTPFILFLFPNISYISTISPFLTLSSLSYSPSNSYSRTSSSSSSSSLSPPTSYYYFSFSSYSIYSTATLLPLTSSSLSP